MEKPLSEPDQEGIVFKRKFFWDFSAEFPAGNIENSLVKMTAIPSEEQIDFLKATWHLVNRDTWNEFTTTHVGMEPNNPILEQITTVLRSFFDFTAPDDRELPLGKCHLSFKDATGMVLDRWELSEVRPVEADLGYLDYTTNEDIDLTVRWKYKNIKHFNGDL